MLQFQVLKCLMIHHWKDDLFLLVGGLDQEVWWRSSQIYLLEHEIMENEEVEIDVSIFHLDIHLHEVHYILLHFVVAIMVGI